MAERLGLSSPPNVSSQSHPQFFSPYPVIVVTLCPSNVDPMDQAPILICRPEGFTLAARGVFARLAVWYLRRYVRAICRGEK